MKKFWAGGFLYNSKNNTVLLHKRDSKTKFNPNLWAFFGGLNEKAESPVDCFIRELREEIGIRLNKEEAIPLCNYFNKEFQTHRFVFYAISYKDKSNFVLNEGKDLAWVKFNQLDKLSLTEKTKRDLNFFLGERKRDIIN